MTGRRRRVAVAVLAVAALRLVEPLVAPGLMPADAGEFQLAARELGVAHPPGYALYTMAAHLFGRVVNVAPFGTLLGAPTPFDVAQRCARPDVPCADTWTWGVNLFSALLALATLLVVGWTVVRFAGSVAAGVLGAVVLALTPTFLAQATVANIRMPAALFTALVLFLVVAWLEGSPGPPITPGEADGPNGVPDDGMGTRVDRRLVVLAFVFGLAAGHHGSLAFLGLPIAVVVLWQRPGLWRDGRTLVAMAGAFLLALVPLAYLPLRDRAGAVLATGNLGTIDGLLYHITAAGFAGDVLYAEDWATVWDRLLVLGNILWIQFGLTLGLAVVGAWWLVQERPKVAFLFLSTLVFTSALAITYRAPQTMEYLLPAYVAIALLVGASGAVIRRLVQLRFELAAAARETPELPARRPIVEEGVILLVALMAILPRLALPAQVRAANAAQAPPLAILRDCGQAKTVLASWHFATPLWYAARHLIPRPDLDVQYVYPDGAVPIGTTWLRRLQAATGVTLLSNRTPQIVAADVALWPADDGAYFAVDPAICAAPTPATPTDAVFGRLVRLKAARLTADAGLPPEVGLEWEAVDAVTETLTVAAQLVDPSSGIVWGQSDRAYGPARWNDPRGIADRAVLIPFRGPLPPRLDVAVGVYRSTPQGPERLPVHGEPAAVVGTVEVPSTADPRPPAPTAGEIPFGSAMTLLGSSVREVDDDTLLVDLSWWAQEAFGSDYTMSVQVHGDGWSAQDDGTPAQGAIPTLKWLPGMVIHDRHRVELPPDRPRDRPFVVTVGVYDAFTLEPLPVTDAERVRAGQGQAAEVYRQP